jgi:uncharacterized membrane protein (DUF4010 family)
MFLVTVILSKIADGKKSDSETINNPETNPASNKNPLEFRTAAIFGVLFVVFAIVTEFVSERNGGSGITDLAYIVGITDIDPFLLNLLQQKSAIGQSTIVFAIINATNSNNLLKMIYALSMGSKSIRKSVIINFSILIAAGLLMSLVIHLL